MSLYKEIEKLKFDKRLTDWHVSHGKISRADFEKHLASLPDSATNVESLRLTEEAAALADRTMNGNGSGNGSSF